MTVRIDVPPRLLWVGATVAGVVHLLAPGLLLRSGAVAYRWFLRVEFDPIPGAKQRVRLVGVGFLVAAAALRRLLDR
jgi:hypothetical protein